jgi:hypothetical protein
MRDGSGNLDTLDRRCFGPSAAWDVQFDRAILRLPAAVPAADALGQLQGALPAVRDALRRPSSASANIPMICFCVNCGGRMHPSPCQTDSAQI